MIAFMVASFVRPVRTALFDLKHGAVSKRTDPEALELRIDGKTKKRVSVTLPAAVSIYDNIVKLSEHKKPSDYLFYPDEPNRSVAMAITTNGSGNATLTLTTPLTQGALPAANTPVQFINPRITCCYDPYSLSGGAELLDGHEGYSFAFTQAIRVN